MYILYKKKLLENNYIVYCEKINELIFLLKNINFIDQEEYLYLIMKIIDIYIYQNNEIKISETKNSEIDIKNVKIIGNKYIKLVNITLLNNKIIYCIQKITQENTLIKIILLFIKKENKNSRENIIYIGELLSTDYFMYWNSNELYKIIKNNISASNNRLYTSIKKYKKDFSKSYDYKSNTLKDLYLDECNQKENSKYKFTKENNIFDEFIKDLDILDKKI